MGEVYRARDTRLDREVAIKVLPAQFAAREDLRQRFEREARAISSLHHPHICALHDIGQQDGISYLVMEYLAGEPLDKRIERGPLPVTEALAISIQIADALDEAHRKGLMHRDLKPANVILTATGAKLLDFGLAKAMEQPSPAPMASDATLTRRQLTTEGTIVGTLGYMSPERLEGKEGDARADIFAFGAVLYEMLTGRRAFAGESNASLIASIMSADPAPMSLAPGATPTLERVIRKCLAKSPDQRWQTARDLMSELQWIDEGGPQPAATPLALKQGSRSLTGWIAAAVLLGVLAALAFVHFREEEPVQPLVRFDFSLPDKVILRTIDIPTPSPDGRRIAFSAIGPDQHSRLWVRSLDSPGVRQLPGTEGAALPFWSPDSRQIGFAADGKLKRVDAEGGPAQTICGLQSNYGAATWNQTGVILFGNGGILRQVPAQGGEPKPVTQLGKGERTQYWPHFLPDGTHFLYNSDHEQASQDGVYVGSLNGGASRKLFGGDTKAMYAGAGYLMFNQGGTLYAQAFDPGRAELQGDPLLVADHLLTFGTSAGANFSVSSNGVLAYRTGAAGVDFQMAWYDRSGNRVSSIGALGEFSNPAISPDERWLAISQTDRQTDTRDLWLYDLKRGTSTRLTFDPAEDLNASFSPDGLRIAFTSSRKGARDLYIVDASGTRQPEVILQSSQPKNLEQWSPDGKYLLYNAQLPDTPSDLYLVSVAGDRKPMPVFTSPFTEDMARISPNGRWIAYRSQESGVSEVYVQSFAPGSEAPRKKWRISPDGGLEPQWRSDGKELFYLRDGTLMAVDVQTEGPEFEAGLPKPLFDKFLPTIRRNRFVASRDGQRFFMIAQSEDQVSSETHVVLNWRLGLRK